MSRFNIVGSEGVDITLGKETFNLKPLKGKDIEVFTNIKEDDQYGAMSAIILKTLQNEDSTITKEDVDEMPLGLFQKIAEKVSELNELK